MKTLVIVLTAMTLISCAGHCVKLSGGYSGLEGTIEYCVDPDRSKEAERAVVKNQKGDSLILITDEDANKIMMEKYDLELKNRELRDKIKNPKRKTPLKIKSVRVLYRDPILSLAQHLKNK